MKFLCFAAATSLFVTSAFAFTSVSVPHQSTTRTIRTSQSSSSSTTKTSSSTSTFSSTLALFGTTTRTLEGRKIQGDLRPLNNFLLVRKSDAIEQTEGGILLTGKAKIVKTEGSVVAVGPGRVHPDTGIVFDMPIVPGEGVVYGKYDGTEIELDGKPHTLIRDDDILVKFTGDSLTLESVDVVRDNVLVSVDDKSEQTTEGGILIAKSKKTEHRPSTGVVVKVGSGRMASNGEVMPMDVQPGDMVKFRDYTGNEVEIQGKEYSVVKMVDILAKF